MSKRLQVPAKVILISGLETYAMCTDRFGVATQLNLPAWLRFFLIWLALFMLYNWIYCRKAWKKTQRGSKRLILLFAGFVSLYQLVFWSFRNTHDFSFLFSSFRSCASSGITWAGLTCIIVSLLLLVNCGIEGIERGRKGHKDEKNLCRLCGYRSFRATLNRHPFIWGFLGAFLSYVPFLYFLFPGSYGWDTMFQLQQWFGTTAYHASTPLMTTILYGVLFDTGQFLFYTNQGGMFMIFLGQACCMAGAVGLVMSTAMKCGMSGKFRLITFLFLVLNPIFPSFVAFCNKDTPYLAAVMALTCFSIRVFVRRWGAQVPQTGNGTYYYPIWDCIGFGLSLFLTMTLRLNGPLAGWAVVISICVVYLRRIWLEAEARKVLVRLLISCVVLPVTVYLLFTQWFSPKLIINGGKASAIDSLRDLLFLQTARAVRDYPEDIKEKEKETLSQMWDYSQLPEYVSDIAVDTVRNNRIGWSQDYLKVWWDIGRRVPQAYMDASLAMSGKYLYLFSPIDRFTGYTMDDRTEGPLVGVNVLMEEQSRRRSFFSELMTRYAYTFPMILVSNAAPYLWLGIYLILLASGRCKSEHWIVNAVSLSMILSSLFSPAAAIRYALPVIGCIPIQFMAIRITKKQSEISDRSLITDEPQ